MKRREFIATSAAAAASLTATGSVAAATQPKQDADRSGGFKLKYAPHFGMFRHHAGDDLVDQLKFAADEGFTAWEDNGMPGRSVQDQERCGQAMRDLGMTMGVFVAYSGFGREDFVLNTSNEFQDNLRRHMTAMLDVAQRVNAKWCTVVPANFTTRIEQDYQTANCIENLKVMAEVCEPSGLTMVLEPLNWWRDHPGLFLTQVPQAYLICKGVGSPSCKILDDLYHQQISEGNLIPNLDHAWDEIAYIQVGDNPGRKEPTTGEINYKNVFRHLHRKGYTGVVGMEHGNSQGGLEGERRVIDAYKEVDAFE
ncbi:MAG: hydroxypyruvate isomerase family protein [Phycisphaerales bacterium JB063]